VLSQNPSPKAREAVLAIAKGASNPDLQEQAITYLGMTALKENRQALADIYATTQSKDVKRRILQAYMVGGERDRLLAVAKGEADVDLRREAVRQLGVMHGTDQLWQMYQAEKVVDVKREIIRAMFLSRDVDRVTLLARDEADLSLRREAVRSLGLMGGTSAADVLGQLYWAQGQPPEIRREVVNALFMQGNAKALVEIARKETDPDLKKDIVSRLSMMKSKDATDYLMELINK
jgi:PBS lyase HEAT-like repeat